ncbi:MAG TPA: DNA-processing protein DprA [Longimicrobiales bacterium]
MSPTAHEPAALNRAELTARLTLRALPGLRDSAINRLIREHGSAQRALRDHSQLIAVGAKKLPDDAIRERVGKALDTIERDGMQVLTPVDSLYPRRLLQLLAAQSPPLLFLLGDPSLLRDVGVAIVGSRAMSEYGRAMAEDLARDLASAGVCIVSGLARGVDAVAHRAALDAGGATIAVLGNGVDVIYPPDNRRLRDDIARRGLLISQYLPGERPKPHHFPERNLVLAAVSEGVVVVEAGAKSGALVTAGHAGDLNIQAMAVPGAVGRPGSVGVNQLIRDGVVCVTNAAEVLETIDRTGLAAQLNAQRIRQLARAGDRSLRHRDAVDDGAGSALSAPVSASPAPVDAGDCARVLAVLGNEALHIDDIAVRAILAPGATLAALAELELTGQARQHPGARFSRKRTVLQVNTVADAATGGRARGITRGEST